MYFFFPFFVLTFPLFSLLRRPCENKKITPSFTTGIAKTPRIRVGNPDALYRDFSPNYFKDNLCFHTVSQAVERRYKLIDFCLLIVYVCLQK